jgi:hypothetical protein
MKMDLINALFELGGTFMMLPSLERVYRTKIVQGVHWLTPLFFWLWGLWNIFYYPSLDQGLSFIAGCLLFVTNTAWLYLILRYTPRNT